MGYIYLGDWVFTLDRLYRTQTTVELADGKIITIRALGESEERQREQMAYVGAAKYRKVLRNKDSDEYLAYVEALDELTDEQLRNVLVQIYSQLDGVEEARKQSKPRFVPEPDNADDSEVMDTIEAQEEEDKIANEKFFEALKSITEDYKKMIEPYDREKLLAEAKAMTVRNMAYSEYLRLRILASLYIATELNGKRFFSSIEELDNANRDLVNTLYQKFVEVNDVSNWEIAKAALQGK